jgi:gamma-glutamyltranspeptidase/glutathione hydrolase
VYEIPPNGQGIAALKCSTSWRRSRSSSFKIPADAPHVMIEAKKLAYADMYRYVADQKFSSVPVAGMLSKEYAAQRAKLIDMAKANCDVGPGNPEFSTKGDTMYLSVVDRDGNMVSLIQSNYSGIRLRSRRDGTGFALQNRGGLFSLDPKSPNALAAHKRPLHTIIPGFMTRGQERIAFGIMGGFNQSQAHAQFVSNVADFGMNIQAALEAPRFTKYTFTGCDVMMEDRFPADSPRRTHLSAATKSTFKAASPSSRRRPSRPPRFPTHAKTGVRKTTAPPIQRKDGEAIPILSQAHSELN